MSRPTRTRVTVGVVVVALLAYGTRLAHSDHDYRNTIVWFGGYAGVAGFLVACAVASTRRRYVCVLIVGVVIVGAVLAFAYLANLFGWTVGARLGSLLRTGGTRPLPPPSKPV